MIDLKEDEAVKFGDNLLVAPRGTIKFEIDGEEVVIDVKYNADPMVIAPNTQVYKKVSSSQCKLSHYVDGDTIVTREDFSRKLSDLDDEYAQFFELDDGEYNFYANIDEEYQYKKKRKNINDSHEAVYVDIEPVWELIQFKIIGELCDTKSPYITNALSVGKKSFNGSMFKVDLSLASYDKFIELSKKYGSDKVKFFTDNKKYLRFAKINDKYLFNDSFDKDSLSYVTSLEDAHDKVKMIQTKVEKIVIDYLFPTGIDKPMAQTLISDLNNIRNRVIDLDVKKIDLNNQKFVRDKISEIVNKLELYVNNDRERCL